jgi:hypothetical protein
MRGGQMSGTTPLLLISVARAGAEFFPRKLQGASCRSNPQLAAQCMRGLSPSEAAAEVTNSMSVDQRAATLSAMLPHTAADIMQVCTWPGSGFLRFKVQDMDVPSTLQRTVKRPVGCSCKAYVWLWTSRDLSHAKSTAVSQLQRKSP